MHVVTCLANRGHGGSARYLQWPQNRQPGYMATWGNLSSRHCLCLPLTLANSLLSQEQGLEVSVVVVMEWGRGRLPNILCVWGRRAQRLG